MPRTGTVSLIGAGPGDPGLITVRGADALRAADVVLYDDLVSPRLLRLCRPGARLVPVGKRGGRPSPSQASIDARLVREARAGRDVARLKGGDPFVFGRGGEEALALRRTGVRFTIIPGVSSAVAAPAYAGIPVTHRGLASSVTMFTGHEDPAKGGSSLRWAGLAAGDTLVCLMGVTSLPTVVGQLLRHGRAPHTPAAVVEWGTTPRQRTVTATLATIVSQARRARLAPPAVLIVGHVVSLRRRLRWFESQPLFGRRILVTRAADKANALTPQLEALGAEVDELPAIELAPVAANGWVRDAMRSLPSADWVFFTSPEGIRWFSKMLKPLRKDLRLLAGCRLGAIGPKTAVALEEQGLRVDFVPRRYSQEGMVDDLPRRMVQGRRAVILSAEGSRDVLAQGLRRRGMRVATVPLYRAAVPARLAARMAELADEPFDLVTVTSASCVDHLARALGAASPRRRLAKWRFASIGPVTSQAVRAHGGRVAVEARVSTIEGLVDAIRRWSRV